MVTQAGLCSSAPFSCFSRPSLTTHVGFLFILELFSAGKYKMQTESKILISCNIRDKFSLLTYPTVMESPF